MDLLPSNQYGRILKKCPAFLLLEDLKLFTPLKMVVQTSLPMKAALLWYGKGGVKLLQINKQIYNIN